MMTETEAEIKALIEKSNRILIFSHIRPDWDAVSSALLTYSILHQQFPQKSIQVGIEDCNVTNGEYLEGYQYLVKSTVQVQVEAHSPDLIILTDCPSFARISRDHGYLESYFQRIDRPSIIAIDHHPQETELLPDILINNNSNDAVEEVHQLLVKKLGYMEPTAVYQFLGAGILNDTNNFMFLKNNFVQTLAYTKEILEHGFLLDEINRQITRYTPQHLLVVAEFLTHSANDDCITYFWVTDKFYTTHPEIPTSVYSVAKDIVNHYFLRSTTFNEVFLIIYPEKGGYKGSFRALIGKYDTTVFAKKLGGGGQVPASGIFVTTPGPIESVIQSIVKIVHENFEQARILTPAKKI